MPHKHKRKRADDASLHDLPSLSQAQPLPNRPAKGDKKQDRHQVKKRKGNGGVSPSTYKGDDTPRAFARLMALQTSGKRIRSGLDDGTESTGTKRGKGRESSKPKSTVVTENQKKTKMSQPVPKILPGESLRDFSARVDNLLPISAVPKSSQPSSKAISRQLGLKDATTRHNKRLQKLIANWREEDARLHERRREEDDEQAEADDAADNDSDDEKAETRRQAKQLWSQAILARDKDKKGKKLRVKKRRDALRGADAASNSDDDDDPWRQFNEKKVAETKQRGPQDVVQAPPTLKSVKANFKDIPKKSYTRRQTGASGTSGVRIEDTKLLEELGRERERFLREWRKMKGLKGSGG